VFISSYLLHVYNDKLSGYNVVFVGMVFPGDILKVSIKHTSMRDGNMVVKVETKNQNGEKVLEGSAEVSQPPTVYVFIGQGSQEPDLDHTQTILCSTGPL
jgi:fatty acid synthase subunit alpha, fungi type